MSILVKSVVMPPYKILQLTKFSYYAKIGTLRSEKLNLSELFGYEDGKLYNLKSKHVYHNLDRDGYIRVRILGKEYRAHRIIWELFNGPIPDGMLIDHIDRDVSNNRIENLRLVTPKQNLSNKSYGVKGRELPKGVTKNPSGKYRARVTYNGITYSLGTYSTIEEASNAVKLKDIEVRGEYSSFV